MAITTYQITSSPAVQWLAAGDAFRFTVTVPSGGPTLTLSSDSQGQNVLATVAAGTNTIVANYGGIYYSSPLPGGATVVATSTRLTSNGTFTTVANTGTETVTAQLLIPANVLPQNGILRIRYQVKCASVTSTPTLQAKLYLGALGTISDTAIQTVATTAILANGIITGEMELVVGAVPSATTAITGTGTFALAGAAGQTVVNSTLASTNFPTNGPLYISLALLWSASSASNSAAATIFDVTLP